MSFCYLSQIVIWIVIPSTRNGRADHANNTLSLIVLIQWSRWAELLDFQLEYTRGISQNSSIRRYHSLYMNSPIV